MCRWIGLFCALICLLSIVTDHQCLGDEISIDDKTVSDTSKDFNPTENLQPEKTTDTPSLTDDIVQLPDTSDENTIKSSSNELIDTSRSDKGDVEDDLNNGKIKPDSNDIHDFFEMNDKGTDQPNLNVDSDENKVTDGKNVEENSAISLPLNTDNSDSSETADHNDSKELSLSAMFQNNENDMEASSGEIQTLSSDEANSKPGKRTPDIPFSKQTKMSRLLLSDGIKNSDSDSDLGGKSNDDQTSEDFSDGKVHSSCKNMDIVFVLDSSDDVEDNEFQSIRQSLIKSSDVLLTQQNNVRIGVVVYGSRITEIIPLSNNAAEIAKSAAIISPSTGLNKPYLGILAGRGVLSGSPISNKTKILVFIATGLGQFVKPAIQQSEMAQRDGIYVMTIGYGDGTTFSDLEEVASGHSLSYMFESADDVVESTDKLSSEICRAPTYKKNEDDSSSSEGRFDMQKDDKSDEDEFGSEFYNMKDENDYSYENSDSKSTEDSDDSRSDDISIEIGRNTDDDSEDKSNGSSDNSDSDTSDNEQAYGKQSPEELCANSKMVHGVGYKMHHTDCDKFIQCYYDESGKTRASVMQCPFGEFWDHQSTACVESVETNCPNDPCKAPGLFRRPTGNGCGSYWSCKNGKSVIACCPENMSYQSQKGCVLDPKCSSLCPPNERSSYETCDKRPLYGKPYLYKQWIVSGHWVEMLCAPGTLFDENDCGCTMRETYVSSLGVRARASETCRPELYLPFCQGLKDWSGKNTLVQNEEDKVLVTDGKAYFNGDASLFIPRFSGATYGETIYIKLRYKPDFTKDYEGNNDQILDSDEDNIYNMEIRWKPFVFRRKRRDTNDVANDMKPAFSTQTMSVSNLDDLKIKNIPDNLQHLDKIVDIEKTSIDETLVNPDDKGLPDADTSPQVLISSIEKTDSTNKGDSVEIIGSVNAEIDADDKKKSTMASSGENGQTVLPDSDSSENYYPLFETSVFDDRNGDHSHEKNVDPFAPDKFEKQKAEWFDTDKNDIKDGSTHVMLSGPQDESDQNSGEYYFKNWFTSSGKDSSENSKESDSDNNAITPEHVKIGTKVDHVSVERDSSVAAADIKTDDNVKSFEMKQGRNFNFNFNSNKPQFYGDYSSDENNFEDNDFYRWESGSNEKVKQAWDGLNDENNGNAHKSKMFDNKDDSQEDINWIIKNRKGNNININDINFADNTIVGNSNQNRNIYLADIETNGVDKTLIDTPNNDVRVRAYDKYNKREGNVIKKTVSGKGNTYSNDWMAIVSQPSGKGNDNIDNSVAIETDISNFNTKFESSSDKVNVPQSYFAHTNPDVKREKIQDFDFIETERNDIFNEIQESVQNERAFEFSGEKNEQLSAMALISNGNCDSDSRSKCHEDPSLSIGTEKGSVTYTVYASESKKTRIKLHQKYTDDDDGWRTALFTINEGVFRVFDDHSTDFEPVSGPVETTFTGIYIGKGTGMKNFKGYIDEVYVYFCQPEDMEDFSNIDVPINENAKTGDDCDYINKHVGQYYNRESSEESDSPVSWWER